MAGSQITRRTTPDIPVIGVDVEAWNSNLDALAAVADQTSYGRAFLALVNAAGARAAIMAQQPAITDPTSGVVIDAQARTAIAAIIDALQANGIVGL